MPFLQGDDGIQNLPPATSDPSFRKAILPGSLHPGAFRLPTGCFQEAEHLRIELSIPIEEDVTTASGKASRSCWMIPSAVGCGVTLPCRILRRWCSMTKKQYNTRNVTVGTVKKWKAAIPSR